MPWIRPLSPSALRPTSLRRRPILTPAGGSSELLVIEQFNGLQGARRDSLAERSELVDKICFHFLILTIFFEYRY